MQNSGKDNGWVWPRVNTIENAKRAANHGMYASLLVAGITTIVVGIAIYSSTRMFGFIDAWSFLDVALFLACAYGIHKESRAAAIFGLTLFLLEKFFQVYLMGEFNGWGWAVILTAMFVSGVRGTYALRRLRQAEAEAEADAVADAEGDPAA